MRVLIAGCGYVGTALCELLVRDGRHVWALRRGGVVLPKGAESVQGDVTKPDTLTMLPASLDAVVYAVSAGGYEEARYRAAYIDGPRNILDALRANSPRLKRFVFVSSTGVYAQSGGEWVDEDSPAEQSHFSGATLLEGERIVASSPFPATVVRLGGIYGPGRTRLIESVKNGSATLPSTPTYLNLIHRDDCAGIIRHILSTANASNLYLGVDNEPSDRRVILKWIAKQIGAASPPVEEGATSARGQRGNKRCRNARIREAGYEFRYPTFREGLAQELDA
ncbi:MAG: SDR family oxidoreductase [Candidatus Hydrogenedentes bacterium]|nr:SDR family oxidoreductase [Candidatus Hydrogenedentota bacterium]